MNAMVDDIIRTSNPKGNNQTNYDENDPFKFVDKNIVKVEVEQYITAITAKSNKEQFNKVSCPQASLPPMFSPPFSGSLNQIGLNNFQMSVLMADPIYPREAPSNLELSFSNSNRMLSSNNWL